jgi:FKBP-type peptidyl-prolyl cis-trans isomerase (trigger factor)
LEAEKAADGAVKERLIVTEIARIEGLELTDKEYTEGAQKYADQYQYESLEAFEAENDKERISNSLLQEKVIEFIYANCIIDET